MIASSALRLPEPVLVWCALLPSREPPTSLGPDREAALGIKEVQVAGIHAELHTAARRYSAARAGARSPHGLALGERDPRLVLVLVSDEGRGVLVLNRWVSSRNITRISLPSSSVTLAVPGIRAQPESARLASSKSDGRMPRITSRPKYRSRPGLPLITLWLPSPPFSRFQ
jgi:hypothetical protein